MIILNTLPQMDERVYAFQSFRIYWITINSQGLVVLMTAICHTISSALVIWPRQMTILLPQYYLLILTFIFYLT